MGVAPLALEVTLVCCMAGYLLHYYGNWKKQNITVTVAAFVSWYFSFLIIFTLPLDISNTCYRQCLLDNTPVTTPSYTTSGFNTSNLTTPEFTPTIQPGTNTSEFATSETPFDMPVLHSACKVPWSYVSSHVLENLWHVVYWSSQFLTWLVIPLMQSYANAGEFSILGKLKTGLIENAIYYGLYLLIFGVCLIYIAIRPDIRVDGKSLKVLATTASNTWGLTLLVLMWGYGLVEVPRRMWNNSHKGRMLSYTYFKLAKLSVEKTEAEENLEDVLDDVKKATDTIKYNHPLRKHVETILDKCPAVTQEAIRKTTREVYEDFHNPTETPTEKSLVRLHKKVIRASQTQQRTQCQWERFMKRAFELDDIAQNQNNSRKVFQTTSTYDGILQKCYSPRLEWYWKCILFPWILRLLSVILIVLSAVVVWSECLFFVRTPTLSIFALFLELATEKYNYAAIELMCILTMAYLSVCAYYTVFKVRFFNYYYLAGHHQTNEYSLLFAGMMLTRLTPPLCLNFLGLIHMDSHVTKDNHIVETSFTKIMGHMDLIKFISDGFMIYYPIAIVLLCFGTVFNICARVLHFLGFQQFVSDDDMTQELVDEGKNLMTRERRRMERHEENATRRREWNERFGSSDRSSVRGGGGAVGGPSQQELDDPTSRRYESYGGANPNRKRLPPSSEYGSTLNSSIETSQSPPTPFTATSTKTINAQNKLDKKKNNKNDKSKDKRSEIMGDIDDVYTVTDGKHTIARSPQENDRSNLLREVEPIGYTDPLDPFEDEGGDPFQDDLDGNMGGVHGPGAGYQSRAVRPSSLRMGNNTSSSSSRKPQAKSRGPPKGIFDDV